MKQVYTPNNCMLMVDGSEIRSQPTWDFFV